jgi:hypothetical protein
MLVSHFRPQPTDGPQPCSPVSIFLDKNRRYIGQSQSVRRQGTNQHDALISTGVVAGHLTCWATHPSTLQVPLGSGCAQSASTSSADP